MQYRSKSHTVQGFQFRPQSINDDKPDWFIEAEKIGKASVTINPKQQHITIYSEFHEERAAPGWWICLSPVGKLYVLNDDDFKSLYEEIE